MSALNAAQAAPALEPVRTELLNRAVEDAHRQVDEATQEAQRILAHAREHATALTETARAAGQAAAAVATSERRAALRRTLRGDVLAARRDSYQQWRRCGTEAVLRLRDDPAYPRWVAAMRAAASAALGAEAHLSEHPQGGVVVDAGQRRVDWSLPGIAERALDATAPQVGELWS
ncbi:hypothetical protein [Mycobacterium sp.]|uniref:hypothetical protein n=1 Tax=Mycobacterium sp. TaxID=1785 RepID=UPI002CFC5FF9|nr:hypothetical protein [Mycobacterium sp.]HME47834.1 hypothetical protein [Mycobacterium sp.]